MIEPASPWDLGPALEQRERMRNKEKRDAARRSFSERAGPCPNCGAPAEVELIEYGYEGARVAGLASCSRRCWEEDPQGYIDAVKRQAKNS